MFSSHRLPCPKCYTHNIIAFLDSFVLNPSMHCDKRKDSVYYKCTHNAVQYQNVLLKIVLFYPVFCAYSVANSTETSCELSLQCSMCCLHELLSIEMNCDINTRRRWGSWILISLCWHCLVIFPDRSVTLNKYTMSKFLVILINYLVTMCCL